MRAKVDFTETLKRFNSVRDILLNCDNYHTIFVKIFLKE